jgi:hypothetical protein
MEEKRVTGDVFTTGQRRSHREALGYDGYLCCLSRCWSWLLLVMEIPSLHLPQMQHIHRQSQGYHLHGQKHHSLKHRFSLLVHDLKFS